MSHTKVLLLELLLGSSSWYTVVTVVLGRRDPSGVARPLPAVCLYLVWSRMSSYIARITLSDGLAIRQALPTSGIAR